MLECALEDFVDVCAFFCVCLRSQSQAFSALALPWRYGTHDSNDLHRGCSHEGSCPHRSTLVLRKDSVIYFHGRSPYHIQITSAGARSPWSSSEAYMFLRSWRSSIPEAGHAWDHLPPSALPHPCERSPGLSGYHMRQKRSCEWSLPSDRGVATPLTSQHGFESDSSLSGSSPKTTATIPASFAIIPKLP